MTGSSPTRAATPAPFRPCVLVPTFDNPATLRAVVERARVHVPDVIVVDDGSGPEGRRAAEGLQSDGLARVHRLEANAGKGAAVKRGFEIARKLGFTHAVQVDADGQHDLEDIPRFVEAARAHPAALVAGTPVFDETVPLARLRGRRITIFWTDLETGGRAIQDPLCGFRVYPVESALGAAPRGDRMDFDPEIAVRMVWGGAPVINLPTRVRYLSEEEGGVSHFRMLQDNVAISWMHTRLVVEKLLRGLLRLLGIGQERRS